MVVCVNGRFEGMLALPLPWRLGGCFCDLGFRSFGLRPSALRTCSIPLVCRMGGGGWGDTGIKYTMRRSSLVKKGGSASEAAFFFNSDADLQTLLRIPNLQAPLFNIQEEPMSENISMSQPYRWGLS